MFVAGHLSEEGRLELMDLHVEYVWRLVAHYDGQRKQEDR
jgi:hypothetical protein